MIDFTKPGFYRMRNGKKAEVFGKRGCFIYGGFVHSSEGFDSTEWSVSGQWGLVPSKFDLIEPWVEPVCVEGWVTVSKYGIGSGFESREQALVYSNDARKLRWDGTKVIDITEEV